MSLMPFPEDHPFHPNNQPEPRATRIVEAIGTAMPLIMGLFRRGGQGGGSGSRLRRRRSQTGQRTSYRRQGGR